MIKTVKYMTVALAGLFTFGTLASCSDDDLDSKSIFDDDSTEETSEFDQWLYDNYVKDYNISFQYRYIDRETNLQYNVVPAEYDKAKGMAKLLKYVWLDAYKEVAGEDFIRQYSFKVVQLIGSFIYQEDGSKVLGTAEKGLKIMLYGINNLDFDNIFVNLEDPHDKTDNPLNGNYYFFHTMHHEFCHILTQTKDFTTDFREISTGKYHNSDWQTRTDAVAVPDGFVSTYASMNYTEDFAETYSIYVTSNETGWQKVLTMAGDDGAAIIKQKLEMVRSYFQDSWGIDIDEVRSVVNRRSAEAKYLDLRTLD